MIAGGPTLREQKDHRIIGHLKSKWKVTAFYKRESQGKNTPGDWKERTYSLSSPAYVMLRGSGVFLFGQIHVAVVTTPSACDANKQVVGSVNHGSI